MGVVDAPGRGWYLPSTLHKLLSFEHLLLGDKLSFNIEGQLLKRQTQAYRKSVGVKTFLYTQQQDWPSPPDPNSVFGGHSYFLLDLIIYDTFSCFYKLSLPLTPLIPFNSGSKTPKVKLNPERRILNGKIRQQICLNHHLLLIRKSMAFDARVCVCLWC